MVPHWQIPVSVIVAAASMASALGGLLLFFRKAWSEDSLYAMVSVGGGLLLALTVLDLLPQSLTGGKHVMPFVLFGFGLLFVMEVAQRQVSGWQGSAYGVLLGFVIHSFVEGLSLMASLEANQQLQLTFLGSFILHKIPDGITVGAFILQATRSRVAALTGAAVPGIALLLGVWAMAAAHELIPQSWTRGAMAMATGVFLYISASHLVPYIQRSGRPQMALYFFGTILFYFSLHLYFGTHA
ncbi:ZIP family metal transporter [Brevibacillus massiliensis]|uniref:ZIP family metal transporter n=1 Tax=Brevibacillus massiliensis TaxID=1118054 RepID=UPI000376C049|nr:ZIP family metal transporter [Brevibacillus massiliensis]